MTFLFFSLGTELVAAEFVLNVGCFSICSLCWKGQTFVVLCYSTVKCSYLSWIWRTFKYATFLGATTSHEVNYRSRVCDILTRENSLRYSWGQGHPDALTLTLTLSLTLALTLMSGCPWRQNSRVKSLASGRSRQDVLLRLQPPVQETSLLNLSL